MCVYVGVCMCISNSIWNCWFPLKLQKFLAWIHWGLFIIEPVEWRKGTQSLAGGEKEKVASPNYGYFNDQRKGIPF